MAIVIKRQGRKATLKAGNLWIALTKIIVSILLMTPGSLSAQADTVEDYCQYESFQPRCLKNEAIIMKSATYGRMRVGRCITAKEVAGLGPVIGEDPQYMGCSADVLSTFDQKCSGKTSCEVRVVDMALENATPCYNGLNVYLEVSYDCVSVADEERSCSVTASIEPTHILSSAESQRRACGTASQPWTVEAPIGQKISISLRDFSALESAQMAEQSKQSCNSYGVILDSISKRNVTICATGVEREKDLYTSTGNAIGLILTQENHRENSADAKQFILKLEAVGCSDLIPPEDAWLKRSDDSIVIGCYSSRQTWHLHCEAEKWIGVFGNCSQADDEIVQLEAKTERWSDEQILTVIAVGGFTLTICLAVLCTGIVCLRRYSSRGKKRQDYRTLDFQINSTRSQQLNQPVQSSIALNSTGYGGRVLGVGEMPTYSVFVGESDFNDVDNPNNFSNTNSNARL